MHSCVIILLIKCSENLWHRVIASRLLGGVAILKRSITLFGIWTSRHFASISTEARNLKDFSSRLIGIRSDTNKILAPWAFNLAPSVAELVEAINHLRHFVTPPPAEHIMIVPLWRIHSPPPAIPCILKNKASCHLAVVVETSYYAIIWKYSGNAAYMILNEVLEARQLF